MKDYFSEVIRFFEQNNLKMPKGCSSDQIDQLEAQIGFELPNAYRAFLALMGNDTTGVLRGTDCFLHHVIENTAYLPDLLNHNGVDFKLPRNYLAFYCHQGYAVSWFVLPKASENPMCYMYTEGGAENPIEVDYFRQFITNDILHNAALEIENGSSKNWWQFWK